MRPGTKLPHEITVYGKDQVSVNDEGEIEVIHMAVDA
jgi:hypothetical protein